MRRLVGVLLTAKLAFAAHEAATGFKLMERGLKKEDLALVVLIDFPLEIIFGFLAARWSSGPRPLKPWLYAYYGRLIMPIASMALLFMMPTSMDGLDTTWYAIIVVMTIVGNFFATVQFVSIGSFFAAIADPRVGGTYMTVPFVV